MLLTSLINPEPWPHTAMVETVGHSVESASAAGRVEANWAVAPADTRWLLSGERWAAV